MNLRNAWIAIGRTLATGCMASVILNAHAGIDHWTSNGPYGGQVSVLAADPRNPSVMYAAGFSGIFKTTDGALTWSRASNGITDPTVAAIAVDPVTSSTVYAGSVQGGPMVKSMDAGATWHAAGPTAVVAIAIPAQLPSTIYAAQQQSGILKSTDGGATWNKVGVATLPAFPTFKNLVVDPTNPSTLYAGETSKGVYKSTDGGATWAAANTGFTTGSIIQVLKLAVDPSNPATLYAAASTSTSAGLYKTTNAGASWTQVFTDASSVIGVQAVAVDPTNSGVVYMGTFGQGLRKSVDGGTTFVAANAGLPKVGVNVVVVNPQSPAQVYVGTQNGVFASTSSGGAWVAASAGLALTTVNAIAVDPTVPTTVYAATKLSGLFKSVDGGESWQSINNGIGATGNLGSDTPNIAALAIDATSPGTLYAGTQGTLESQVYKSTNGGATWTAMSTGLPTFGSVSSVAVDPQSSAKVYVGTTSQGLYSSDDGGAHWALSTSTPASAHVTSVSIVGPLPGTTGSSVVGVATEGEGAFIGDAATEGPVFSAKSVLRPIPVSDRCLGLFHEILLNPKDFLDSSKPQYLVYLACVATAAGNFMGFTVPTPSTPGAKALPDPVEWGPPDGDAAKNIACAPVASIALDPANASRFYAASACGALKGSDYGAQIATLNAGLPANLALNAMVATHSGDLHAGSTASGAWKYTPASTASPVTVVEYYNATLDHYFVTWVATEQANLDAGNTPTRWTRTGESFKAYTSAQAGTSAVCRYYIPPNLGDSHFFGRGTMECVATGQKNPTFVDESDDFMQMFLPAAGVCPANTTNVYRVFSNRPDANHRYMTSKTIRDQMVAKGWLVEGDGPDSVVMCAPM